MKIITNKEEALIKVQQDAYSLEYASEDLKNDKNIVLEAVKQNGLSLEYTSEDLKNDKGVVLVAVQQYGHALKYVSEQLKNDKQVVLAAVEEYCGALYYASDEIKIQIGNNAPINKLRELIQIEQEKISLENKINIQDNIKNNKNLIIKI